MTEAPPNSCRWVPWSIAGAFVALTVVLGAMIWLAVHGFPGIATEHAYEKGLAYNSALKAASEQKALGWKGELIAVHGKNHHLAVDFELKDSEAKPIDGAQAELWLVRPAQAALDSQILLQPRAGGHYVTEKTLPAPGVWDLKVSVTYEGRNYQLEKRIVVP